jgi:hypothetical protein
MRIFKKSLFFSLIIFFCLSFANFSIYAAHPLDFDKAVTAITTPYKNFIREYCLYIISFLFVSFVTTDYFYHKKITKFSIILASLISGIILYFGFIA